MRTRHARLEHTTDTGVQLRHCTAAPFVMARRASAGGRLVVATAALLLLIAASASATVTIDESNVIAAISPPFASWSQSSSSTTYLTVSYDSSTVLIPTGSVGLPSVSCVFGNTEACSSPDTFLTDTTGCAYPNATLTTSGRIISSTQMKCAVPSCPSATSQNLGATVDTECTGSYAVTVLVNGSASTSALDFVYLRSADSTVSSDRLPQVQSVSPSVLDLSQYTWITVYGTNFDTPSKYTNPTYGVNATTRSWASDLTSCQIDGSIASSVERTTEIDSTGTNITVIKCYARPRLDLSGSSSAIAVTVEISLNGQEYTSDGVTIDLFDYAKQRLDRGWMHFYIGVAVLGGLFALMILQHFLCTNFFRTHLEEAEAPKIRVIKGPQMLIDLLEPRVHQKVEAAAASDAEREAAIQAKKDAQAKADGEKAISAAADRDADARREEKQRVKAEKKLAKQAARDAKQARRQAQALAGTVEEEISDPSGGDESDASDHDAKDGLAGLQQRKNTNRVADLVVESGPAFGAPPSPSHESRRESSIAPDEAVAAPLLGGDAGIELANLTDEQLAIFNAPDRDEHSAVVPILAPNYDSALNSENEADPHDAASGAIGGAFESSRSGLGSEVVARGSGRKKKKKGGKRVADLPGTGSESASSPLFDDALASAGATSSKKKKSRGAGSAKKKKRANADESQLLAQGDASAGSDGVSDGDEIKSHKKKSRSKKGKSSSKKKKKEEQE